MWSCWGGVLTLGFTVSSMTEFLLSFCLQVPSWQFCRSFAGFVSVRREKHSQAAAGIWGHNSHWKRCTCHTRALLHLRLGALQSCHSDPPQACSQLPQGSSLSSRQSWVSAELFPMPTPGGLMTWFCTQSHDIFSWIWDKYLNKEHQTSMITERKYLERRTFCLMAGPECRSMQGWAPWMRKNPYALLRAQSKTGPSGTFWKAYRKSSRD